MSTMMENDISGSKKVDSITAPITADPVPRGMKACEKALSEFQSQVEERAFAAMVLASALSHVFRRSALDGPNAIRLEPNPLQSERGGMISWLRLDEVGLQPDFTPERCAKAMETFLQAMHMPERRRILFCVSSDGNKVDVRIGLQAVGENRNPKEEAAFMGFMGDFATVNWPGLSFSAEPRERDKRLAAERIAGFVRGEDVEGTKRSYFADVRVLTGLPAIRKSDDGRVLSPATIDKLAAALVGRKWAYVVNAEPLANVEMEDTLRLCREFSGRAESVKSFQFGQSLSNTFSQAFTRSYGRNEGVSRTKAFPNWIVAGAEIAAAAALSVLCPPLAGMAFGAVAEDAILGALGGASLMFGLSRMGQQTQGQNYGEAVADTISATKGANITESVVSKHAEAAAKLIDAQTRRYEQAEALGAWDVGVYFIGEDESTAELGANVLKAILSGDDSYLEPLRVHSYPGNGLFDMERDPVEALLRFENPRVALVSGTGEAQPRHPLGSRFDELRTILNTRELVHYVNFPLSNLPGVPVRRIPADTGLSDSGADDACMELGKQMFRGTVLQSRPLCISPSLLAKHALVCGINGSGKTNTILGILGSLLGDVAAPFLVIEPAKQEYVDWAVARNRELAKKCGNVEKARKSPKWINVYVPGRETWRGERLEKLNLNPFDFVWINPDEPPKTLEHIDRLKTVVNAAMPMQEVLPVLMEELIYMAYGVPKAPRRAGEASPSWLPKDATQRYPDFDEKIHLPSFHSLSIQLRHLFASRTYAKDVQLNLRAALETRIDSFKRGWRKEMLNKDAPRHSRADWEALFERPTVVNLTSLTSDEDKAFFMAVLLLFVYEYRQECSELGASAPTSAKAGRLRHLLVVEEAHRVLGKAEPASSFSANPKQKVSEMFSNMISEVRAYGQGILIADQIPCRLNEDAVKNTNLKIVHKLVSADDRAAMATALNLWEDQERVIGDLGVGEVLVRGDMDKQAVMVKVNKNF
ncbi:MAG: ATP-binding protein [Kiritimatiellae bacterium]|nr:ATP-binding protein [Kiritimatiellia bacterium]